MRIETPTTKPSQAKKISSHSEQLLLPSLSIKSDGNLNGLLTLIAAVQAKKMTAMPL